MCVYMCMCDVSMHVCMYVSVCELIYFACIFEYECDCIVPFAIVVHVIISMNSAIIIRIY